MNPLRYLALGDSYTIGESVAPDEAFPFQLAARLRAQGLDLAEPEIIARTGWTTDELQAAIDERAPRGPYDVVTLLIGVNNQYRERAAETYLPEFRALLEQAIAFAGQRAARVIVISIPDWGVTPFGRARENVAAEIDAYNVINRAATLRLGAHYIEITQDSRRALNDASLIAADGLHPSAKMYGEWVDKLAPLARSILQEA